MKSANFFKSTPYHLSAPCGAHRIPLGFTLISPTLLLLSSSISKSSNLLGLNVLADIFYSSIYAQTISRPVHCVKKGFCLHGGNVFAKQCAFCYYWIV